MAKQKSMTDQLQRRQSRNAAAERQINQEKIRRRQIRSWIILVGVFLAVVLGIRFLSGYRESNDNRMTVSKLPCYSNQSVTPFRDGLIYYDGASIHHLSSTGTIRWSFPAGSDINFSVGPTHMAVWSGRQLFLVNQNGNATYNESLEGEVQFVRVGERYVAVVVGEDTEPKLIVKDLNGGQVDAEEDAYSGLLILDAGFFGNQGEYMWTLALDVFGTAPNTIMNTFQVGKMNMGPVSLGEAMTYKVVYENAQLRVFTTQQVYTYDYRCVPDTNSTMLVYGWKLIDYEVPKRGRAKLLLAPTSQTSSAQIISELRVLEGDRDKRYTLPAKCVGAYIYNGNIYAVSGDYVYRADTGSQRFFGYAIPGNRDGEITASYGITSDGKMLLASGWSMYALTLPK